MERGEDKVSFASGRPPADVEGTDSALDGSCENATHCI